MKLWRTPFDQEAKATKPGIVLIDKDRCKGCGYCVEFCPKNALAMSDELNQKGYTPPKVVDKHKCLGCGLCEIICPEFAIKLEQGNDMKQ
jgi:2-oxoglutarate ferredoxin oxidoreductase subunit delta